MKAAVLKHYRRITEHDVEYRLALQRQQAMREVMEEAAKNGPNQNLPRPEKARARHFSIEFSFAPDNASMAPGKSTFDDPFHGSLLPGDQRR